MCNELIITENVKKKRVLIRFQHSRRHFELFVTDEYNELFDSSYFVRGYLLVYGQIKKRKGEGACTGHMLPVEASDSLAAQDVRRGVAAQEITPPDMQLQWLTFGCLQTSLDKQQSIDDSLKSST